MKGPEREDLKGNKKKKRREDVGPECVSASNLGLGVNH